MATLELVTIEDARTQLRLDTGGADDPWLEIFIPAISQAVAEWLKDEWRLYVPETDANGKVIEDSNGDPIPLEDSNGFTTSPVVRAAVLIELAAQMKDREGGGENAVPMEAGHGYVLGYGATRLLSGRRKSTVS